MLSTYVPIALALVGTVLMAVVIFAPVPVPATVTISFAPPIVPPYEPPTYDSPRHEPLAFDAPALNERSVASVGTEPRWPVLVDPAAFACDAATRLELVRALAAVRGPWADAVLRQALEDEPDAAVRNAIVRETTAPA